jgi:predicted nuclease of predicted toxin-antitoxin system
MPVSLYLDVHVDKAIHDQLRLRGVDVLRAQDDNAAEMLDEDVLARASNLGRVVFTHDIGFKALAEDWQRRSKTFAGLAFGNQLGVTTGTYVRDLELIAKATEPTEWVNVVQHLPYK